MLAIEWKASADADLCEILDFISEQSEQGAENLLQRIIHDLEHAAKHPHLFKTSQRITGLREIVVHPNYVVLYRITSNYIEVVNVVHVRLEFPGSHRKIR